jgi:hypothetical protein
MDNKFFGKSYSKFFLNTLISSAFILCLMGFPPVQINAETPAPVVRSDNPSCGDLGYSNGYKVDEPGTGTNTYTLPNGGRIIVSIDAEGKVLNFFASGQFIIAAIVKGAENANVYYYTPSVRDGGPLTSPMKDGRIPQISHFSFCYDNERMWV